MARYLPIEDYAAIGNLRTVILVSKDGSIDWAPAPFVDSPSIFASILDKDRGGFWYIKPKGEFSSTQRYIKDTNVLETTFLMTNGGKAEMTDFMPIDKGNAFIPAENSASFRIIRKVVCIKGTCRMLMKCKPRFDYGRGETRLVDLEDGARISHSIGSGVLLSRSQIDVSGDTATSEIELTEGEQAIFVFRYNKENVWDDVDVSDDDYEKELEDTKVLWRAWANSCDLKVCPTHDGPWEAMISRSLLMLRLLFFEPVGTVAAAPTTSLPEEIGGMRNWDYRYTWLRDSSFIFDAFFRFGHTKEARLYLEWILKICAEQAPEHLKIMYPLYGDRVLTEETLDHLDGYRGSKPVRIGNGAHGQKQWDIYGNILNVAWELHRLQGGEPIGPSHWKLLRGIANHIGHIWREPDEGLWEVRGGKDHFLYSKVMCYVGLDRAVRLAEAYQYEGEVEWWLQERNAIKDQVFEKGWNEDLQSFVHAYDSTELDATALLFPRVGFIDGDHPKMVSTVRAIREKLRCEEDGLLYRHSFSDGLSGRSGADLFASFWLVDALVFAGEVDDAKEMFERLLEKANHVGLFSEEYDPKEGCFLGNFPQAYTHVGVLNSAHRLREALAERKEKNVHTSNSEG